MTVSDFYTSFEFTDVLTSNQRSKKVDLSDIWQLGVDKAYFSGEFPAILFKEVSAFDTATLKEIARIQHLCWNYRKVSFLMVLSSQEIRIYNCCKLPFNYEFEKVDLANELNKIEVVRSKFDDLVSLQLIKQIFSKAAVDCGVLWNTDNELREKIVLHERIDKYLVHSLLTAARELKNLNLQDDIIHSLLMRSMFIMYLEDKGAAKETNLYRKILAGANSYIDILRDKTATYTLFEQVEDHFNGNVFPVLTGEKKGVSLKHLDVIRKCLFDGDQSGQSKLFRDWRLFRFDIIQIELLSEIYEHFLEEFKGKEKEKAGQYYTPPSLVELVLNEKLKVKNEKVWKLKILDPACGSGIFLVEAFKRLVKRWKNSHPGKQITFSELRQIIEDNIFGIEYDKFAIRVTAFSLYLAMLEHLNPRTLWMDRRYKFPYLIFDPEDKQLTKQGKNLLRQDTIGQVSTDAIGEVDLVVGNPPFGSSIELESIKKYCIENKYGQDMVIPFLHKAPDYSPNGSIALIFNTKVLTNNEGPFQNFRKWLFNENYVEKIYNFSIFRKTPKTFGGQLFSSAIGPISIIFFQRTAPAKRSKTIEYWAPKSYVKNTLVEGVIIDGTDIKFLPRAECQKPNTKIWKISMWGSVEDFKLINKFDEIPKLAEVFTKKKIVNGVGIRFLDKSTKKPITDNELPKLPYITPDAIQRFYTSRHNFIKLHNGLTEDSKQLYRQYYNIGITESLKQINVFRRIGIRKEVYYAPHVLIKYGLSDKKICASFLDENCVFNGKVLGITGESAEFLKALSAIINSKVSTYYLFLISSSIGIEREEIKPYEFYQLPFHADSSAFKRLAEKIDLIKERVNENFPLQVDTSDIESEINEIVFDLFQFSKNERILIDDFLTYTVSLLFDGHKSIALKPILSNDILSYANTVTNELNFFLSSENHIVNASVFDISKATPLNIIKISFDKDKREVQFLDDNLFDSYLSSLNEYTLSSLSKSIYIQKQIKYYDDNCILLIKPNQKRFWSRSSAISDSKEIIAEILKM